MVSTFAKGFHDVYAFKLIYGSRILHETNLHKITMRTYFTFNIDVWGV